MRSAFGVDHGYVAKTYMGANVFKPVTAMSAGERRAIKNGLLAGPKPHRPEGSWPMQFFHDKHGPMRVVGYRKGKFIGIDKNDERRHFGRDEGYFGKAYVPEKVPKRVADTMPRSTVAAYDNSGKRKVRAAASNYGTRVVAGSLGTAAGIGLAALAGSKMKSMNEVTRIGVLGHTIKISPKMKGRWAQSTVGGIAGGAAGTYAGDRHLKRIERSSKYEYRRKS
jgi:hypothetical protein